MRFFAPRSFGSFRSALLLAGPAVFLPVSAPPKNDFSCFCLFPDSCLFLGFGFPLFQKFKKSKKEKWRRRWRRSEACPRACACAAGIARARALHHRQVVLFYFILFYFIAFHLQCICIPNAMQIFKTFNINVLSVEFFCKIFMNVGLKNCEFCKLFLR